MNAEFMERMMNSMQISGEIREPGFKRNKANTKDVFSFKFIKDGTDKPMTIYLKESEEALQAEAIRSNGSHVTIEGSESQSGDKTYFNPTAIKESEAPKQETLTSAANKQPQFQRVEPKETDWDMIGRQKARCSIIESACTYFAGQKLAVDVSEIINMAKEFESYVFSTKPADAAKQPATARKVAPEGMFAEGGTEPAVMANAAQLSNLKKYVKAKSQSELLSIAKYRYPDSKITKLEDLTLDQADEWLAEVMKK